MTTQEKKDRELTCYRATEALSNLDPQDALICVQQWLEDNSLVGAICDLWEIPSP